MLSKVFPASHPNAGEMTNFRTNLLAALDPTKIVWEYLKLHTIRANYELFYTFQILIQYGIYQQLHGLA